MASIKIIIIKEQGTLVPTERGQKRKADSDRNKRAEKRLRKELVSNVLDESDFQQTEISVVDEGELPTVEEVEIPVITHINASVQTDPTDGELILPFFIFQSTNRLYLSPEEIPSVIALFLGPYSNHL